MPTLRRLASRLSIVVLSIAAPSLLAQTTPPPQPPEQRPTFRTEASFVRVDAYPTKDGKPVLDLTAADFEVFEDGNAQTVASFEHVVVRPAIAAADRIEPTSQREMLQAAANPRNRVFVIFLDGPHVSVGNSNTIAGPLIRLINRILGPDDLVGVMTPRMSVAELVLARRTEVTEEQLRKHWTWGERFGLMRDDLEESYIECYPPMSSERGTQSSLASRMIARKRERVTLEALEDLVRYLTGVREERKAILAVTEGWALFRPDDSLNALRKDEITGRQDPVPGVDPVGIGPGGTLVTRDPRKLVPSRMDCDVDRMRLASMDNERFLRDMINEANRANASFYPIDPRGLAVFDTPLGPDVPLSLSADAASLKTRQEAMRTLATGTDGLAVMDSNDLDKGLRRIADDLSSYYLLGYYSTNTKLDGGYRSLRVRVTRPGVEVRARRGYRAASVDDVARARKAAAAPEVDVKTPVAAAIATLGGIRPESRLRLQATIGPEPGVLWVIGEVTAAPGRPDEWGQGANVDLQLSGGGASSGARVTLKPGERSFITSMKVPSAAVAGVDVQARVAAVDSATSPATDSLRLPAAVQPLFYRRGPSTANRQVPTADLRFTRAERAHLELPMSSHAQSGAGRLLDRTGKELTVPVTVGQRVDDASGQRWLVADVVLAPLAPGDYVVELVTVVGGGESRVVAGLRIVR